jgi:lysophospholipase L1-like esterase
MRNLTPLRIWLLALTALFLVACGDQPALNPLPPDGVILAFGDSLTEGVGAGEAQSYPALLADLSGRRVINAGLSGEESDAGLARLPELLATWQPDLVILGHGGNDFLRQRDTAKTKANLAEMIAMARAQGSAVVLLGVPRPGLFLRPHPLYDELADSLAVPVQADAIARILADKTLKSDQIHPNAAGYRQLADAIHRLLRDSGALNGV